MENNYSNLKVVSNKAQARTLKVGEYYISNWDHQPPHIAQVKEVYEDGYHAGHIVGRIPMDFVPLHKE